MDDRTVHLDRLHNVLFKCCVTLDRSPYIASAFLRLAVGMPAGGGSAGGGGGGFSGGGGYYGGGSYYGSRHSGGGDCGPIGSFFAIFSIVVIGTIVVLSVSLSVGTELHKISRNTNIYGLTDNLIYPFRGDFCQNLRATSTNIPGAQTTAFLYFLKNRPSLTDHESFNLSSDISLDSFNNFRNWNFILNAGSNSSFIVCYNDAETRYDVIFNLIRGVDNFERWVDDVKRSHTLQSFQLNERCTSFIYNVTIDANYYFVFYLPSNRQTNLNVSFEFDRTLYSLSPDLVIDNCSFPLDGQSSCSMGLPISSGYVTFVSFETTPPVDYNDGAYIHFTCSPRGWLYAVIVLVVVFVAVAIMFSVIFFCVIAARLSSKKSSRTVSSGTNTNNLDNTSKL